MPVIDPALVNIFGFWGAVLVLKILAMVPITARYRFSKKVMANEEDVNFSSKAKVAFDDPDVERVRRCHLNDLENILPWFIITYIYLGTNPSVWLASNLIRGFVFSRISHTLAYVVYRTQPARAIAFFVGYFIMGYQAVVCLIHFI